MIILIHLPEYRSHIQFVFVSFCFRANCNCWEWNRRKEYLCFGQAQSHWIYMPFRPNILNKCATQPYWQTDRYDPPTSIHGNSFDEIIWRRRFFLRKLPFSPMQSFFSKIPNAMDITIFTKFDEVHLKGLNKINLINLLILFVGFLLKTILLELLLIENYFAIDLSTPVSASLLVLNHVNRKEIHKDLTRICSHQWRNVLSIILYILLIMTLI